jgi:hypothetical protein
MPYVPSEVVAGGQVLYIEVADAGPLTDDGPQTAGLGPAELIGKLETVGEAAGEACKALFAKLNTALSGAKPEEITVEFGITIGGETGIPFVAKGKAEAAFTVSATWKPTSTAEAPAQGGANV